MHYTKCMENAYKDGSNCWIMNGSCEDFVKWAKAWIYLTCLTSTPVFKKVHGEAL